MPATDQFEHLQHLVRMLLIDLPAKRDWLDPALERDLRSLSTPYGVDVGDWVQTITGIGFVEQVDPTRADGQWFQISTNDEFLHWYTRQEITEVRKRS